MNKKQILTFFITCSMLQAHASQPSRPAGWRPPTAAEQRAAEEVERRMAAGEKPRKVLSLEEAERRRVAFLEKEAKRKAAGAKPKRPKKVKPKTKKASYELTPEEFLQEQFHHTLSIGELTPQKYRELRGMVRNLQHMDPKKAAEAQRYLKREDLIADIQEQLGIAPAQDSSVDEKATWVTKVTTLIETLEKINEKLTINNDPTLKQFDSAITNILTVWTTPQVERWQPKQAPVGWDQ